MNSTEMMFTLLIIFLFSQFGRHKQLFKEMSKDEAIYNGFCEIIPFSKDEIEVQVEDGKDEYGTYLIVEFANNLNPSKCYYE